MDKFDSLLAKIEIEETEQKTRRLQLLVYPSIYKAMQILAKKHQVSINNLINIVFDNLIDKAKARVNQNNG